MDNALRYMFAFATAMGCYSSFGMDFEQEYVSVETIAPVVVEFQLPSNGNNDAQKFNEDFKGFVKTLEYAPSTSRSDSYEDEKTTACRLALRRAADMHGVDVLKMCALEIKQHLPDGFVALAQSELAAKKEWQPSHSSNTAYLFDEVLADFLQKNPDKSSIDYLYDHKNGQMGALDFARHIKSHVHITAFEKERCKEEIGVTTYKIKPNNIKPKEIVIPASDDCKKRVAAIKKCIENKDLEPMFSVMHATSVMEIWDKTKELQTMYEVLLFESDITWNSANQVKAEFLLDKLLYVFLRNHPTKKWFEYAYGTMNAKACAEHIASDMYKERYVRATQPKIAPVIDKKEDTTSILDNLLKKAEESDSKLEKDTDNNNQMVVFDPKFAEHQIKNIVEEKIEPVQQAIKPGSSWFSFRGGAIMASVVAVAYVGYRYFTTKK